MIDIKKFFSHLLLLIHITFPLISKADDQKLNSLYSRIESLKESIIMYSYLENELSNLSNTNDISTTNIKNLIELSQTISSYIKLEIKTNPNNKSYRDGLNIIINNYENTLNKINTNINNSKNKKSPIKNKNHSYSTPESYVPVITGGGREELLIKEEINSIMRTIQNALNEDLTNIPISYKDPTLSLDPIWIMYDQYIYDQNDANLPANLPYKITLPISSLMFFDKLCIAYAWLEFHHKENQLEIIKRYINLFKYYHDYLFASFYSKNNQLLHLYLLDILDIPHNALNDPRVNNLSQFLRNSGYTFILAHQLGIIYNLSRGDQKTIQDEANQFALDIMLKVNQLPYGALGAMLFYQMITYYLPNPGDILLKNREFLFEPPQVTAEQLKSIVAMLNEIKPQFSQIDTNNTIDLVTNNFLELANFLDNLDIQIEMAKKYH